MSFKTFNHFININDSINISFCGDKKIIEEIERQDNSLFLTFPEFKNLTIYSKKSSKEECVDLLNTLIDPKIFKYITKNSILNNINSQYVVDTIIYKKFFSEYLPVIPLIRVLDNSTSVPNSCIYIDSIPIGIQIDSNHIFPFVILFKLIKTLIINNGVFIFDYLNYDIIETKIENGNDFYYVLVLNDNVRINRNDKLYKLSTGDIIFSINGNQFNRNGKIYYDKLDLYLPINLYLMLIGHNKISLDILSNSKLKTQNILQGHHIKKIDITLPIFNQQQLRIPIFPEKKFTFKNMEFSILSEKIMEKYMDCPLDKKHFERNTYSSHKYIVLTNHESHKLYILKKITNKKISDFEEMVTYITNMSDKNKKTFYFERVDDYMQITV